MDLVERLSAHIAMMAPHQKTREAGRLLIDSLAEIAPTTNTGIAEMKTCETCKHWEKPEEHSTEYSLGVGRCKNIPMFWNSTEWKDDGEGRRFLDEYKDTKAFAQDGSDYSAHVLTLPNFGCVSHKDAI